MDEFNDRMQAQRKVLCIVNSHQLWREELCGLSQNAIERWASVNHCDQDGPSMTILKDISKSLFFLATKSQEQVSKEYQNLSSNVAKLTEELKATIELGGP